MSAKLTDKKLGLLRGLYPKDKDDKLIQIRVGELREAHNALKRQQEKINDLETRLDQALALREGTV